MRHPCPEASLVLRRPWWGACGYISQLVTCTHANACTHTRTKGSPVVWHWEACSGISFINLTALVGDLESVWPQKETALSLPSTNITVFLERLHVSPQDKFTLKAEHANSMTESDRDKQKCKQQYRDRWCCGSKDIQKEVIKAFICSCIYAKSQSFRYVTNGKWWVFIQGSD